MKSQVLTLIFLIYPSAQVPKKCSLSTWQTSRRSPTLFFCILLCSSALSLKKENLIRFRIVLISLIKPVINVRGCKWSHKLSKMIWNAPKYIPSTNVHGLQSITNTPTVHRGQWTESFVPLFLDVAQQKSGSWGAFDLVVWCATVAVYRSLPRDLVECLELKRLHDWTVGKRVRLRQLVAKPPKVAQDSCRQFSWH